MDFLEPFPEADSCKCEPQTRAHVQSRVWVVDDIRYIVTVNVTAGIGLNVLNGLNETQVHVNRGVFIPLVAETYAVKIGVAEGSQRLALIVGDDRRALLNARPQ